jgi:hypothetical protein
MNGIESIFVGMGLGDAVFSVIPVRSFSVSAPRGSAYFNDRVSFDDETEQSLLYISADEATMLVYKIKDAIDSLKSLCNWTA